MDYRNVMRLLPGDEERMALAEKGVFSLEEIDNSSSYTLTQHFLYKHLFQVSTPIWIVMNSPGGDVAHGLAIYDAIRMLAARGREVNVLGIGHVASMATVIMQAATNRYSTPHTQFLIHQVSQTIVDHEEVNKSKDRVEETERLNNIVMGLIASRVGIDLEELKELCKKKDYWLDSESALKFGNHGLIDKVVTELLF